MQINLLGIGAVKIQTCNISLYLDAYNSYNPAPKLKPGDIVLFTHDDEDHFKPETLIPELLPETLIIGPPSIAKPLWDSGKVSPKQIQIRYPKEYDKTERIDTPEVSLKIFNTEHFVGWHNLHISFLLEAEGRKVYITGDSDIRPENEEELNTLDALIVSLLKEETVKVMEDRSHAPYYNLSQILEIQRRLKPKCLIANHLIGCDWAAEPEALKALVDQSRLPSVLIPLTTEETITI